MRIHQWLTFAAIGLVVGCGTDFNAPPTSGSFAVTPTASTGVADGSSVITLVAQIDSTTPAENAHVEFTTTLGTFGASSTTLTATADGSGKAIAQLKAPAAPGQAIVTAKFAGLTKITEIIFTAPRTSQGVVAVDFAPRSAPADGASIVTIRFTVDTSPRPNPASVTVATTAGSFVGTTGTLTASVNDSGFAYARLKAPADSSVATLTITSAGHTRYVDISFPPAPPDQVQLSVASFELKAGTANAAALTAQLSRLVGTPSPGVSLSFSADTAQGTTGDFGLFSPRTTISGSATVTTRFTAGTSAYRGPVTIRVRASRSGVVVTDSTLIWVVP